MKEEEEESNIIWNIFSLMDKGERSKEKSVLFSKRNRWLARRVVWEGWLFHPAQIEAPPSEKGRDSIVKRMLTRVFRSWKIKDALCRGYGRYSVFYDPLTHSVEKNFDRKTFVRFYFTRSKRSKRIELTHQFNFWIGKIGIRVIGNEANEGITDKDNFEYWPEDR